MEQRRQQQQQQRSFSLGAVPTTATSTADDRRSSLMLLISPPESPSSTKTTDHMVTTTATATATARKKRQKTQIRTAQDENFRYTNQFRVYIPPPTPSEVPGATTSSPSSPPIIDSASSSSSPSSSPNLPLLQQQQQQQQHEYIKTLQHCMQALELENRLLAEDNRKAQHELDLIRAECFDLATKLLNEEIKDLDNGVINICYKHVIENADIAIVIIDAVRQVPVFVNNACEKIFGYTAEEWKGQNVWEIDPSIERTQLRWAALIQSGRDAITFKNHFRTKSGHEFEATVSWTLVRDPANHMPRFLIVHVIPSYFDESLRNRYADPSAEEEVLKELF